MTQTKTSFQGLAPPGLNSPLSAVVALEGPLGSSMTSETAEELNRLYPTIA